MKLFKLVKYENQPAIEATWINDKDENVRCEVFGNSQMQLLRDAIGESITAAQRKLINDVEKTYKPLPVETPVPVCCTPAQGLVALYHNLGKTEDDIHQLIESIEDATQKYTVKIAFSRATEWRRDSLSMSVMGDLLGLTSTELDELFIFANNVSV